MSEIRIVDRDIEIIREINRWRVSTGRVIAVIAGFSGLRACDRRLGKLCESGYLERKKVLYGVAGIYTLTHRARLLAGLPERPESTRIEQIPHDIAVTETAIHLNKTKGVPFGDITTEKQLHQQDGFGVRRHRPDFIYTHAGETTAVEVELSLKAKARLEANVLANFKDYDHQLWVIPDLQSRIAQILREQMKQYPNILLLELKEVKDYVRNIIR
ncbi:MAG: replication-relaxation family protein [Oscillospiraceae bacterium]|nr:replication-relaxation family protein [Oscillospiraceae bacterium]